MVVFPELPVSLDFPESLGTACLSKLVLFVTSPSPREDWKLVKEVRMVAVDPASEERLALQGTAARVLYV
jgi:hypothetical protein